MPPPTSSNSNISELPARGKRQTNACAGDSAQQRDKANRSSNRRTARNNAIRRRKRLLRVPWLGYGVVNQRGKARASTSTDTALAPCSLTTRASSLSDAPVVSTSSTSNRR